MYNPYEDYSELLEDTESDESFASFESDESGEDLEWDERARRPGGARRPMPKRVNTARRGNNLPQRAPQGVATKAELQQTAARLDAKIATNSKAVQTLDGRVRTVITENGRMSAALAKEIKERKTTTEALKKSIDEQRQISMLLPLLSTYEKKTVGGTDNVLVDTGDKLSSLLPILLMSGGFGGSGSGQGGLFGGGDNSMATMALVIALADK